MIIIVSHNNTDMDGLGAMVAAGKLYPEAQMVFVGKLCRNVQEFMSLHRDTLNIAMVKDIPLDQVTKVIIVDTKSRGRLGAIEQLLGRPGLEIHIYDHHPTSADDIRGEVELVETLGATTTMLVEIIKDLGIQLNSMEATVLALGIYEDTGSLTFPTTTPRDAEAVAYLLTCGAKLSIVADFIDRPLSIEQQELLNMLLPTASYHVFNGVKVVIASGYVPEFISGLALLTHKLGEITNIDVIFSVVKMEDRIHLVARSRDEAVNVDVIMKAFNGGGHSKAASATIKSPLEVVEVVEKLLVVIKENIKPIIVARQIMSSPVKTVTQNTTVEETGRILLRYGHTGLPVVDGDKIVGVISRRDIDKARHSGLTHAPVKGFMSRNVKTVSPDAPLQELQGEMIAKNIGRLPVVENGRLIGIVSRTDILKTLHGEYSPHNYHQVYQECAAASDQSSNLTELMINNLPYDIKDLLGKVSYLADQKGASVSAVGGFVRDLLLGVENLDIDLVVEGDAIDFARQLAEFLGGRVRTHKKFATAMVILPSGQKIDLATARTEYYAYPAALPQVESSSLHQDLYRRDFTINSMAIALSQQNFGELIDFFRGRSDLDQGVVRILYNLSFVEDPTRLLRAIRFEQRYNFAIESQTLELAKRAINDKMLAKVSNERIRVELKHILGEAEPIKAIRRMGQLQIWPFVIPGLVLGVELLAVLEKLPEMITYVKNRVCDPDEFQPWLVYLLALVHRMDRREGTEACEFLRLSKEETAVISTSLENWRDTLELLANPEVLPFSIQVRALSALPPEAYPLILAAAEKPLVITRMEKYLAHGKHNDLTISGDDIIKLGYKPGPVFKEVLEAVRDARLDGLLLSREAELEFARNYLADRNHFPDERSPAS